MILLAFLSCVFPLRIRKGNIRCCEREGKLMNEIRKEGRVDK